MFTYNELKDSLGYRKFCRKKQKKKLKERGESNGGKGRMLTDVCESRMIPEFKGQLGTQTGRAEYT